MEIARGGTFQGAISNSGIIKTLNDSVSERKPVSL